MFFTLAGQLGGGGSDNEMLTVGKSFFCSCSSEKHQSPDLHKPAAPLSILPLALQEHEKHTSTAESTARHA